MRPPHEPVETSPDPPNQDMFKVVPLNLAVDGLSGLTVLFFDSIYR